MCIITTETFWRIYWSKIWVNTITMFWHLISSITKVIQMPRNLRGSDLEAQVELQADQYIPFPMEEVSFDFEVIGPSEKDPEMLDVLLVAIGIYWLLLLIRGTRAIQVLVGLGALIGLRVAAEDCVVMSG